MLVFFPLSLSLSILNVDQGITPPLELLSEAQPLKPKQRMSLYMIKCHCFVEYMYVPDSFLSNLLNELSLNPRWAVEI